MIISYIVKEVIVYDDRIDITWNSPIIANPDIERRGFCFYMRNMRVDKRLILISMIVE